MYRRCDGEKEIFFRLSEKWVKNNYDPKNTVYDSYSIQASFCWLT